MKSLRAAWRTLRPPAVADFLLALLIAAFQALLILTLELRGPLPALLALDAAASAVLLRRRDRPLTVLAVTVACNLVAVGAGLPVWLGPAAACALYSAGVYARPRRAWLAAAAVELAVALTLQVGHIVSAERTPASAPLGALVFVGLGQLVRFRRELAERTRAELAAAAVRDERRRIARELHDMVAHHISTMNVLIGAARATMSGRPAQARDTLLTAERTGRAAMAEMRELLHVLRADDAPGAAPAGHGTAALPALIAEIRRAGLPVDYEVAGEPGKLSVAVDHTLYRLVQEALTNVRKHAPGARARVRIVFGAGAVEAEVLDDGPGPQVPHERAEVPRADADGSGGDGDGSGRGDDGSGRGDDGSGRGDDGLSGDGDGSGGGYGLSGMAEWVGACGGRLLAGPRPEGGFRVHALLPAPAEQEET
ncbi:sensor histidine kinase [Sphaerisporangium dianthi]|uniref:histidine kinase n=1 Tax=Sphaerisporangium dianthi TaxID=1436120 RepID=A0ABV9CE29_9ACTN